MEHGAYRVEDAQAHIDALRRQLEKTIEEKARVRRERDALVEGCTFGQKYGGRLCILACWLFVVGVGLALNAVRNHPVEVRYQTIERSCTVEHAVEAEVEAAVRRATEKIAVKRED